MYFELNSTGPYYTLSVSDGNYDLSASLVLTSYLSGLPLTLGATSGTACGNTHATSIYLGTEN